MYNKCFIETLKQQTLNNFETREKFGLAKIIIGITKT